MEDAPARDPSGEPPRKLEPIDPKWIDILMGKEDSVRMRDCLKIIADAEESLDARLAAFDELELLVESIDNATDLLPLGLWAPLVGLLALAPTAPATQDPDSESAQLTAYAAWVCGTAVQNNPKASKAFLDAGGLGPVIRLLHQDMPEFVKSKALYCLSGLIKLSPATLQLFLDHQGMSLLVGLMGGAPSPAFLVKIVFLLKALLRYETVANPGALLATLIQGGILDSLTPLLNGPPFQNADLLEKVLELLSTLYSMDPSCMTPAQCTTIQAALPRLKDAFQGDEALDATLIAELSQKLR